MYYIVSFLDCTVETLLMFELHSSGALKNLKCQHYLTPGLQRRDRRVGQSNGWRWSDLLCLQAVWPAAH